MSTARYLIGDVFDVMSTLPDDSVDLVLTSPPFLALRSYLPADHPDKAKEIGSEPTPAEFLDTLLALTAEWGRLIGPYGSIAVELGDSYAGGNAVGTDHKTKSSRYPNGRGVDGDVIAIDKAGPGWPLDKSICFIPQLYGASLAYGRNLLTGEPSPAGQWRVRNLVAWCRPNPPVGALGDKFRPATSYITIACKARDRWFDLDAVRSNLAESTIQRGEGSPRRRGKHVDSPTGSHGRDFTEQRSNPAGAPPLDWWEISTEPTDAETSRRLRVPVDATGGGIQRTTSPDCPLHGSTDRQGSSAPRDARAGAPTSRNGHTDDRPARAPGAGSSPTPQNVALWDSSPASSPADAPAAKPRSKSSRKTAPDPATTPADTPSARTTPRTDDTSTSPESTDHDPDTNESSTSEACPPVDGHETPLRTSDIQDPSQACCCSYFVEVDAPQVNDSNHYATWPTDYWNVSTEAFSGSHYATWPRKLLTRPIDAMCPRHVCTECGEPRRRLVESQALINGKAHDGSGRFSNADPRTVDKYDHGGTYSSERTTLGWSDCGHDSFRPGVVLDPFAGSGTTLAVATGMGRDAIGIDIDSRNVDLAAQRVGMFLTVETPEAAA